MAWQLYKKKYVQARPSRGRRRGAASSGTPLTDAVPSQFVDATPYVATLLVLALSAQRLRMPKADGLPYRKGQGK